MYGGVMADKVTSIVKDRPTVVTFHGSDLLGEHLSGCLRQLMAYYSVRASWRAARRASGVVTVASVLRDALPKDVDQAKVRIIPCGIDLERFKPLNRDVCRQQLGWDSDSFHVLFPTNCGDPVKRFDLARSAVLALNCLGIRTEMHELSGIENSLVPVWLNASDVLLLSSLHEGSPTVVKEALACNLPVVSVDVGDVRERIRGVDGCYIAAPDPSDLAAKLSLIYSGRRRVAGRVKVQELSLERIALKLKNLYQDLLGS
jgi:glycosyltransferase involved in cell wall biosynthesis